AQGMDANHGQRNQPRVRMATVLWHNQRATIGRILTGASLICAGLYINQVTGLRALRNDWN
ncbi:MAG TPA: hypothetical protein VFU22_25060, partial [Roseiflexaceae bacterium]|nr:hypothetical protein [Roseiflexaceae bacterium]